MQGKTNEEIYYAPPEAGLTLARHILQGVVSQLLTRAHNYAAIGRGPLDPAFISACWLLNIRCTPHEPHQAKAAAAQLAHVRAILGEPAEVVKGYACFALTAEIQACLIALSKGGCHAERF